MVVQDGENLGAQNVSQNRWVWKERDYSVLYDVTDDNCTFEFCTGGEFW